MKIETELERYNVKLSNFNKRVDAVVAICCKLGDLWRAGTLGMRQKIQHLAFPDGVEWDKSILNYRTFTTNDALAVISKLTAYYEEKERGKSTEKSICPLVCG